MWVFILIDNIGAQRQPERDASKLGGGQYRGQKIFAHR